MHRVAVITVSNPESCPYYHAGKCCSGIFMEVKNCNKMGIIKDKGVEYYLPVFPDYCPLKVVEEAEAKDD